MRIGGAHDELSSVLTIYRWVGYLHLTDSLGCASISLICVYLLSSTAAVLSLGSLQLI